MLKRLFSKLVSIFRKEKPETGQAMLEPSNVGPVFFGPKDTGYYQDAYNADDFARMPSSSRPNYFPTGWDASAPMNATRSDPAEFDKNGRALPPRGEHGKFSSKEPQS